MLKFDKLADHEVLIREYPFLNTIKGVVRSRALGNCTEEEIMEHLQDQGVVSCSKLRHMRDGSMVPTDIYLFNFALMERPAFLKISKWHFEINHPYQGKPRQCLNYQHISHIPKYCRRTVPTCCRCGEEGHWHETCIIAV